MPSIRSISMFLLLAAAGTSTAQQLQSPSEFLGYELGTRFTPHHRVVDYFEHVAANTGLAQLQTYGETYEGRPLMVAFVGSESVLSNREAIRENNLRRAGLAVGEPGDGPAVVWLSYNVHGNESVSTEASMATVYELTRPGNERTAEWLENTLVVIDPCINPDGRDRYVNWYNQMVGFRPNADPATREHREPWPGGRTNHYNFDLNRDWAWQTQQESRQRLALFNSWLPQVHVDFHEQGVNSPYYFAPAAEPYHEAITDWQRAFQDSVGTNHARYFDREGWLYFTGEVFDLFYPGYGDTYPMFNGSVGMTYEQGGSGRAGLAVETAEGDTLTLGNRIEHHYTTGLSTVETTSRNAARLVAAFEEFYRGAQDSPQGPYKTFLMKASSGIERMQALTAHLDRLGIRYGTVSRAGATTDGYDYRTGSSRRDRAEPGDLLIPARQPKGILTRVLFEPEAVLPDSITYDITAWALPYAYGMDALALPAEILPDTDWSVPESAGITHDGKRPDHAPYAYLLRWDSPEDVAYLASVFQEGVSARVAEGAFRMDQQDYAPGTIIFTRRGNEDLGARFDEVLTSEARSRGLTLTPVYSGRVESGSDFGSGNVRFVEAPVIAMLTGEGVSSGSAGELWHWFEQQMGYPVSMMNAGDLAGVDLDRYDVLIMPSGSYGRVLSESMTSDLVAWVRAGGTLVALEGAVGSLAGRDAFGIKRVEDEDEDGDSDDAGDLLRRYGDRQRESVVDDVPGAVFNTRVDDTHPLGYGLSRGYFTLRRGSTAYQYLENGWNVGVLESNSRLSGRVGPEVVDRLEDVISFGAEEMGRGSVVYLLDSPMYRGFWYDGGLLLGNAVFLQGR